MRQKEEAFLEGKKAKGSPGVPPRNAGGAEASTSFPETIEQELGRSRFILVSLIHGGNL